MTSPSTSNPVDFNAVLDQMKADRGYLLSFHQFLSRTNLDYLQAYAQYYKQATLENKYLDDRTKETVWIGILSMVGDAVGSIHVERAIKVGIDESTRESIIRLAARASCWGYIKKTSENWRRFQMADPIPAYSLIVEDNHDYRLLGPVADLVMATVSAVLRNEEPYIYHLNKCLNGGYSEHQIVEALTFLVNPLGFNRLQWACDTWLKALESSVITRTELFTAGLPEARIK